MKVIFKELSKEESLDDFLNRCKEHIQISKEELLEKGEYSFCHDVFELSIDDENGNMICDIYWDNEETVHYYVDKLYPDEFYLLSHKRKYSEADLIDYDDDDDDVDFDSIDIAGGFYMLDFTVIRGKDMTIIDEIAFRWERIYNLDEEKIRYQSVKNLEEELYALDWEDDWKYNSHELIKVSDYKVGDMEKYMKKNPNYNEKYHR